MPMPPLIERVLAVCRRALRPLVRKGWWHWVRFGLLLAAASYVSHLLTESDRFTDVRFAIYQFQTRLQRRGPIYPQRTVLVLLNDDDYWGPDFASRDPLKRDQLAILVDKLNAAGANTIALDLDFYSPLPTQPQFEYPMFQAEDAALLAAMQRTCTAGGHIVLVVNIHYAPGGERKSGPSIYEPYPLIYSPSQPGLGCVSIGWGQLPDDIRMIPGQLKMPGDRYLDSYALALLKFTDPIAYDSVIHSHDRGFRFAQFLTPEDFAPKDGRRFIFNGVDVRTMSEIELRRSIADRIVLVGTHFHSLAYGVGHIDDMHFTPGGEEPGTMLVANYAEALLNSTGSFTPISDNTAEFVEWAMVFGLAVIGALEVQAGLKWGAFVLTCVVSVLLTYVLLQNLGLFLDFFVPFLMIVVHTVVEELLEMRRELHHFKKLVKEKHV